MGVRGSRKGERRGGRKKGTPNKATVEVKAALLSVYADIGGNAKLKEWAEENLGEFYKLWAKMLPVQLKNADGQPFQMVLVEQIVTANEDNSQGRPTSPEAA